MLNIYPVVCHCSTTKRGCQTGNRSAVSYSGLMFEITDPHGAGKFTEQITFFIVKGGCKPILSHFAIISQ